MKRPEKIKMGLECCLPRDDERWCDKCPYRGMLGCYGERVDDALSYIQQIERERDAAVEQLRRADKENLLECTHCKHNVRCSEILLGCNGCDNSECPCSTCVDLSNWQWRGAQEVEE